MDAGSFTLETLLQSFSLAASHAEQKIEATQSFQSLSIESISLDFVLVSNSHDRFSFAPFDRDDAIKCKIFKIAGQDAKFLMEESERTGHV